MTGKLEKRTRIVEIDIPFDPRRYAVWVVVSLVSALLAVAFTAIPVIGGTAWLVLIMVYFIPTLMGFDLFETYKEDYGATRIQSPYKVIILWANLFFGITVVGWLVALYLAMKIGRTTTEITEYVET